MTNLYRSLKKVGKLFCKKKRIWWDKILITVNMRTRIEMGQRSTGMRQSMWNGRANHGVKEENYDDE